MKAANKQSDRIEAYLSSHTSENVHYDTLRSAFIASIYFNSASWFNNSMYFQGREIVKLKFHE